jgi:hypothetical protein
VKNRLAHYSVEPDIISWEVWAFSNGVDSRIIGYLKHQPDMLHKFDPDGEHDAFPSPRTWAMAHRRLQAGLSIESVVGPCATQFDAYISMLEQLPNIAQVARGNGANLRFPEEPSIKFACVSGLITMALRDWPTYANCFQWLTTQAADEPEWCQDFVLSIIRVLNRTNTKKAAEYMFELNKMPAAVRWVNEYVAALSAVR